MSGQGRDHVFKIEKHGGTHKGSEKRPHPAEQTHHHGLTGLEIVQRIDRNHREMERAQGTRKAADRCGKYKHQQLGSSNVIAARGRPLFIFPNRFDYRTKGRSEDARDQPEGECNKSKDHVVLGDRIGEVDVQTDDVKGRYRHPAQAIFATRPSFSLVEGVIDDLTECQRHHGKVDPAGSDCQVPDQHADQSSGCDPDRDGEQPVQVGVDDRNAGEVAAHTQERGMTERQHAGVAEEQVEPDGIQTKNQNVHRKRLVGHEQRENQQKQKH